MPIYIVTVKLPKNPDHNPHNKKTGTCPVDMGGSCTDVTGEHHSLLIIAQDIEGAQAEAWFRYKHVTRIEEV